MCVCYIISATSTEQIHNKDWTKQFGSIENDIGSAVTTDSVQNIIIAGNTNSIIGSKSAGSQDIFLKKLSNDGIEIWTRQFGSSDYDYVSEIAVDKFNNIYLTGRAGGLFDINSQNITGDIFVTKFDSNGNHQWSKQYINNAVAYGIYIIDNSIYVTGKSKNFNGSDDIFISKLDSNSNEVWTKQFSSSDVNTGQSIIDNPIFKTLHIVGEKYNQDANSSYDILFNSYLYDGTLNNSITFGTAKIDFATSLSVDSKGNIYIVGFTLGAFSSFINAGKSDIFLAKYSDGNQVWMRQFGTSEDDIARSIVIDDNDNIYITGTTDSSIVENGYVGKTDIFISKFSSDGANIWHKQYGSAMTDIAMSINKNSDNDLFIAGYTDGSLYGNSNVGQKDAFLMKIKRDGDAPIAKIVVIQSDVLQKSISFISESTTNDITTVEYHWDFGDGITSILQNPSHTFRSKGIYTVSLTVSNKGVSDTTSVNVTIGNSSPVANNQSLNVENNVTFSLNGTDSDDDNLTYIITTYPQHGNITQSGLQYIYKVIDNNFAGTDTLQYKVSDSQVNSDIATVTFSITSANKKPQLIISASKRAAQPNEPLDFNVSANDVDGTISSFKWDFGDGQTSTVQNLAHSFENEGSYTVSCTIIDNGGATSRTEFIINIAINHAPTTENISGLKVIQNSVLEILLKGKDLDGTSLEYSIVDNPVYGNVSINSNIASYYAKTYEGNDSFTYKVSDGNKTSNISLVSIDVEVPPISSNKNEIYFSQLNICSDNTVELTGGTSPYNWQADLGSFEYLNSQKSKVSYLPHSILKIDDKINVTDSSLTTHTFEIIAKHVNSITLSPDIIMMPINQNRTFDVICGKAPFKVTAISGFADFSINGSELNISSSSSESTLIFKVTDATGASMTKSIDIVDDSEVDLSIILNKGWNLSAIAVQKNLNSIDYYIFGDYEFIWRYNLNKEWKKNPSTIKFSEGFWIKLKETSKTVNFKGKRYRTQMQNLPPDKWLLLGSGSEILNLKSKYNFNAVWIYNSTTGWVENPSVINAGSGFWVLK